MSNQESTVNASDYLVFRLGHEHYALPTNCVREIARYQPITPIPGTPAELPGIISRHGNVLAVLDPRPLLGLPQDEPTRSCRMLVVYRQELEVALLADAVLDLAPLPADGFGSLPPTLDPTRARLLTGVGNFEGQPLALLDLDALIAVARDGS